MVLTVRCSSQEHPGTGNTLACKGAYLYQWFNCLKKKNAKGYKQHLVSSGGDGSVGRSAYDGELFVLTPFPDLKEWRYFLSELGEVALRL